MIYLIDARGEVYPMSVTQYACLPRAAYERTWVRTQREAAYQLAAALCARREGRS